MMFVCQNCGRMTVPRLQWKLASNDTAHLGAYCGQCGYYIKWMKQTPENVVLAGPPPENEGAQLGLEL